jgi:hypothetical protein
MPIVEDSDTVKTLIEIGDHVVTDDGEGTVAGIALNAAEYNGAWQLEPPTIVVELEDGTTIHTCICSLELLDDEEGTELLHAEYERLWPPMDNEVPEDAEMLIPEGDEEENMRTGEFFWRQRNVRGPVVISDDQDYTEESPTPQDAAYSIIDWYVDFFREMEKELPADVWDDMDAYLNRFRPQSIDTIEELHAALEKLNDQLWDLLTIYGIEYSQFPYVVNRYSELGEQSRQSKPTVAY